MYDEWYEIKEITPEEAKRMVEEGKAILLDVRTREEYEEKHVEGSINIPLHELEERINEIKGKDVVILCFCRSGNRSYMACKILKMYGFKEIYNVMGGITAWERAGFKVVRKTD